MNYFLKIIKSFYIKSLSYLIKLKNYIILEYWDFCFFINKVNWGKVVGGFIIIINIFFLTKSFSIVVIIFKYIGNFFFKIIIYYTYIFFIMCLIILPFLNIFQVLCSKKKDYFCIYPHSFFIINPNDSFLEKCIKIIFHKYYYYFYTLLGVKKLIKLTKKNNKNKFNLNKIIIIIIKYFFIFLIVQLLGIGFIFIRLFFLFLKNWLTDKNITANWEYIFVNPNFIFNKKIYYYNNEWEVNPHPNHNVTRFFVNLRLQQIKFNMLTDDCIEKELIKMKKSTTFNSYKEMGKTFFQLDTKTKPSEFDMFYKQLLHEDNDFYKNIDKSQIEGIFYEISNFNTKNKLIYKDILSLDKEYFWSNYTYAATLLDRSNMQNEKIVHHFVSYENIFNKKFTEKSFNITNPIILNTCFKKSIQFNKYDRFDATGAMFGEKKLTIGLMGDKSEIIKSFSGISGRYNALGYSMYTYSNRPALMGIYNKPIINKTGVYFYMLSENSKTFLKKSGFLDNISDKHLKILLQILEQNQIMTAKSYIIHDYYVSNPKTIYTIIDEYNNM